MSMRRGAVVTHEAHNLGIASSILAAATIFLCSCIHVHAPKKVVVLCKLVDKPANPLDFEKVKLECTWTFKR